MNAKITRRLIELQNNGFEYDYSFSDQHTLTCLQTNACILIKNAVVQVIDQCYDQLNNCYKYIHTVETDNGQKGIMLLEGLCTSCNIN